MNTRVLGVDFAGIFSLMIAAIADAHEHEEKFNEEYEGAGKEINVIGSNVCGVGEEERVEGDEGRLGEDEEDPL